MDTGHSNDLIDLVSRAGYNMQDMSPHVSVLKQRFHQVKHLLALKTTGLKPPRLPPVLNLDQSHVHQLQKLLYAHSSKPPSCCALP